MVPRNINGREELGGSQGTRAEEGKASVHAGDESEEQKNKIRRATAETGKMVAGQDLDSLLLQTM